MSWHYAVAAVLGASVGAGEVISRYRDAPMRALGAPGAWAYVLVNAGAALAALALIRVFNVNFSQPPGDERDWLQILTGGFGAMAFLRSSFFLVRVGDRDVGVGPSGVLTELLDAADRAIDRHRARARARESGRLMVGIGYKTARTALPLYCLWLLQNPDRTAAGLLGEQIKKLDKEPVSDQVKAVSLALMLMNIVGPDLLHAAIETLRSELKP